MHGLGCLNAQYDLPYSKKGCVYDCFTDLESKNSNWLIQDIYTTFWPQPCAYILLFSMHEGMNSAVWLCVQLASRQRHDLELFSWFHRLNAALKNGTGQKCSGATTRSHSQLWAHAAKVRPTVLPWRTGAYFLPDYRFSTNVCIMCSHKINTECNFLYCLFNIVPENNPKISF